MFSSVKGMLLSAAIATSAVLPASFVLSAPAFAAASQEDQDAALEFMKAMSEKAFAVLRNPNFDKSEQKAEFRRLFKEVTAVERIGLFMLGHFQRKFTDEQIEQYTSILPDYVVALYTDRLIEVGDEEVTFQNTYTQGSEDIWIVTKVTSPIGGDDLRADWRVRRLDNGEFTLVDVKIENISLLYTKKDEFMSFLSRNSIEDFLARLERDAARSAAS